MGVEKPRRLQKANSDAVIGWGCLLMLVLVVFGVFRSCSCRSSDSTDGALQVDSRISQLIASGNGHDYLALSQNDRLRLGTEISNRIGVKDGVYFMSALTAFYVGGQPDMNEDILGWKIKDAAAVIAGMASEE